MCYSIYYIITRRFFIKKWFNRQRAFFYKKRKIKESKLPFEDDYLITFNVFLKDISGNHTFEDIFTMNVSAKAAFFARKKLERHIQETINIDIIDIKKKEKNND